MNEPLLGEAGQPHDALAAALTATVVGRQQADGTWLCECGKPYPDDLSLYVHRQRDHAQSGRTEA